MFDFLLFGPGACFVFFVWEGWCLFHFLLFGRVAFIFSLLGQGACFIFAVWAGACLSFLLFGRGREFTHLPACLAGL